MARQVSRRPGSAVSASISLMTAGCEPSAYSVQYDAPTPVGSSHFPSRYESSNRPSRLLQNSIIVSAISWFSLLLLSGLGMSPPAGGLSDQPQHGQRRQRDEITKFWFSMM